MRRACTRSVQPQLFRETRPGNAVTDLDCLFAQCLSDFSTLLERPHAIWGPLSGACLEGLGEHLLRLG